MITDLISGIIPHANKSNVTRREARYVRDLKYKPPTNIGKASRGEEVS
jgi:hypothetical protein